jgi:hypothetical protein
LEDINQKSIIDLKPGSEKDLIRAICIRSTYLSWLKLLFLVVSLGIVVWCADQARWLNPEPSLLTILLIGIFFGFITAKSRSGIVKSLGLAAIAGGLVLFWQCLMVTQGLTLTSRAISLLDNISLYWSYQELGAPIPVTIHLTIIFGAISWIIGYFSSWYLIKKSNPWPAVFTGTIFLLIILNFWPGANYTYFLVFLASALILLFLTNYSNILSKTFPRSSDTNTVLKVWIGLALGIIIVALTVTWISPGFKIAQVAEFARSSNPFTSKIDQNWQNFFAKVPGSGTPTLVHGGQTDLTFGGSLEVSDQVYFIVESGQQNYWKTQIFDQYESTGWRTSPSMDISIPSKVIENITSDGQITNLFTYTLIPQLKTNVLPTVGEFLGADSNIMVKTLMPMTFQIDLLDSSSDSSLPPDIAELAQTIRSARFSSRRMFDSQILALIPPDLKLGELQRSGYRIQAISVSRNATESGNGIALSTAEPLDPQKRISIEVDIPAKASADDLTRAGEAYPKEITDRYLQLPPALPSRVKDLAENITQTALTPYEKAKSLKDYLARFPYSLTINTPEAGVDGVDYFLFTQKSGYCTYFASAMTVMLRAAGIPARLVTGFLSVEYDKVSHLSVLRDKDYHAWTEIYFPGYGWITFDATPGSVISAADQSSSNFSQILPAGDSPGQDSSDNETSPSSFFSFGSKGGLHLLYLLVLTMMGGLLIFYILFRWKIRYHPGLYPSLVFLSKIAGLGPKPWQTPMEFSNQLIARLPDQSKTINRIIENYSFDIYSNDKTVQRIDIDKQSWFKLRSSIIKRIFIRG